MTTMDSAVNIASVVAMLLVSNNLAEKWGKKRSIVSAALVGILCAVVIQTIFLGTLAVMIYPNTIGVINAGLIAAFGMILFIPVAFYAAHRGKKTAASYEAKRDS